MIHFLEDPYGTPIHYLGPKVDTGPLPAFFYFALSGQESLDLHPYNQPAQSIATNSSLRVFSFTIPGHEPGLNKFDAMHYWAEHMLNGKNILEPFFEKVENAIHWLIASHIVIGEKIAAGGLSRGGFVATHIGARIKSIHTLLGFSPLTELMRLKEFANNPSLKEQADPLNLMHLVDQLTHIQNLRFYIGNLDTRVDTDACYTFIRRLAQNGHERHIRHQKIELMITQSIGHKGHGTTPFIFEEGSFWIKHLLGS